MRKIILDLLKAKFLGVSDDILGRIADNLAKTATTEETAKTAVDGVTFQQVLTMYGDSRATQAQQSAVKNYEEKYGIKDGVKVETPQTIQPAATTQTTQQQASAAGDTTNQLLQQLIQQNNALTERLNKMDGERVTASRKQQLDGIIARLPENLRRGYERMTLDSYTDEQFTSLIGEITTEVDGIAGTIQQRGAVFATPSVNQQTGQTGQLTEAQIKAISQREGTPSADGQPF